MPNNYMAQLKMAWSDILPDEAGHLFRVLATASLAPCSLEVVVLIDGQVLVSASGGKATREFLVLDDYCITQRSRVRSENLGVAIVGAFGFSEPAAGEYAYSSTLMGAVVMGPSIVWAMERQGSLVVSRRWSRHEWSLLCAPQEQMREYRNRYVTQKVQLEEVDEGWQTALYLSGTRYPQGEAGDYADALARYREQVAHYDSLYQLQS